MGRAEMNNIINLRRYAWEAKKTLNVTRKTRINYRKNWQKRNYEKYKQIKNTIVQNLLQAKEK